MLETLNTAELTEVAPAPTKGGYGVTSDGYAFDLETGEILGMTNAMGAIITESGGTRFEVTDMDSAEWVLEKMLSAEALAAGHRAKLKVVTENINSQIRQQEQKRAWLEMRFGADQRAFAQSQLEGKKERSIKTAFGTLAFRKSTGSIKVLDQLLAVMWAKVHAPEAIKTVETVLVTPLKGKEDLLPSTAFEIRGPSENFSIETGID